MSSAAGWRRIAAPQAVVAALLTGSLVGVLAAVQPFAAVALILAPLIAALAVQRLPLAVALWIPLMFIEGLPGSRLAPEAFGIFVGAGWVIALWLGDLRGVLDDVRGIVLALGAMLSWMVLSLTWSADLGRAASSWYFIEVALFLLIVATVPRDPRTLRLFAGMIVVGAVVSVAIGFAGLAGGDAAVTQGSRLQGGAGDPNYFAAALLPALALALALARATPSRTARAWLLAATVPLVVGVAASQSRGALVAGAVMAVAALVLFPRERATLLLCVGAVVAVGAMYFALNPDAFTRIGHDQYGGSGRQDLWRVGLRVARDHPVTGVGLNNFELYSPRYVREPGSLSYVKGILRGQEPHNVYLGMLVEVGPIGLLLYLLVPILCLRAALRAGRRFALAGMYGMSVLARAGFVALLGAMTTSFFLPNPADKRLWILMGLLVAFERVAATLPARVPQPRTARRVPASVPRPSISLS